MARKKTKKSNNQDILHINMFNLLYFYLKLKATGWILFSSIWGEVLEKGLYKSIHTQEVSIYMPVCITNLYHTCKLDTVVRSHISSFSGRNWPLNAPASLMVWCEFWVQCLFRNNEQSSGNTKCRPTFLPQTPKASITYKYVRLWGFMSFVDKRFSVADAT